jgi:hypothetical protein
MTFDEWLYEDEGFGVPRIVRMLDDVRIAVEQEKIVSIIDWLMAAYAMGHEQGYDAGYDDCSNENDL